MLTRQHFVAKAAEFKSVLGQVLHDEHRAAILAKVEDYMDLAAESNPRFDRVRFRAACGLAVLPPVGRS